MNTRYITTGLFTSFVLLVGACSINPGKNSNSFDHLFTADSVTKSEVVKESQQTIVPTQDLITDATPSVIEQVIATPQVAEPQVARQVVRQEVNLYDNSYSAPPATNIAIQNASYKPQRIALTDYREFPIPSVGQSEATVLQTYGQPSARQTSANGTAMWDYGSFRLIIQNNTVSYASMWDFNS